VIILHKIFVEKEYIGKTKPMYQTRLNIISASLHKLILLVFLSICSTPLFAQQDSCLNYFSGSNVYSIAETSDAMWFATECRLVEMNKQSKELSFHSLNDNIPCTSYEYSQLVVDSNDSLWLRHKGVLYKKTDSNWTALKEAKNVFENLKIDQDNNKWSVSAPHTFRKFNGSNVIEYEVPREYYIRDYAFDSENNIWIASEAGIVKFKDSVLGVYNDTNSNLLANMLHSIEIDSFDNIWVAGVRFNGQSGFTHFVSKLADGLVKNYTDSLKSGSFDYKHILNMGFDKAENLWLQTSDGLIELDDDSFRHRYSNESRFLSQISFYIDSAGQKWMGTFGAGAIRLNTEGSEYKRLGNSALPYRRVDFIETTYDGTLWLGSGSPSPFKSVTTFDGENWSDEVFDMFKAPSYAYAIIRDNLNNMWVSHGSYIYKYDGRSW
jgi:ligand-binding sensor domain-containing protein